jgi:hypothetical protein
MNDSIMLLRLFLCYWMVLVMSYDTPFFHGRCDFDDRDTIVWAAFSNTRYYTPVCQEHGVELHGYMAWGGWDAMFRSFCKAGAGDWKSVRLWLEGIHGNVYDQSKLD